MIWLLIAMVCTRYGSSNYVQKIIMSSATLRGFHIDLSPFEV